nr:ATP-binding protein [Stenotrophomonas sp. MMGLT7]
MMAALGAVVFLSWLASLSMMATYLSPAPSSANAGFWESRLERLGGTLFKVMPDSVAEKIRRNHAAAGGAQAPGDTRGTAGPSAGQQISAFSNLLTAVALNTLQLAIVGVLMWWAVRASLRPLRSISGEIASRKGLEVAPVPVDRVPDEIKPLISSFNALLLRVEEAVQAERDFVSQAAHELRTPLSALHAYAEVALRADTVEQKDAALQRLLEVARRSNRLAEQLLDLARLDAGINLAGYRDVDLAELAGHVLSEFKVQAENRGVRLVLGNSSCRATCDVDAIGILVRNLVDNAIRYGNRHGLVEVSCDYCVGDEQLRPYIEVCDDGPGVPPEARRSIFERFYRLADGKVPGSGIGLSLVAGIARLHGAQIETGTGVDGLGLCVRVIFPAEAAAATV